jgi:hypothetical protein
MKIYCDDKIHVTDLKTEIKVILSGARGPQGLNGASLYIANDYTYRASLPFEGYETFNVETGLSYTPGQNVVIYPSPGSSLNRSWGIVDSYDIETGELLIYIEFNDGNPSSSHWVVNIAGQQGYEGGEGQTGQKGDPGEGVAAGGLEGQILAKASNSNYDTAWINPGVPYTGATQDVNLGEFGLQTGNIEFDNTPTNVPTTAGSTYWNDTDGTLDLILKGGNVTLQVGQEEVVRVVNKTGGNLLESQYRVCRIRTKAEGGAQGQRLAVVLAQANTKANHSGILGIVTENIDNNQEGFITTFGKVRGVNTTGSLQSETWADGDEIYLSATVAGGLTNVQPVAHPVQIGYVVYAHANNGVIFVKVENGVDELADLHDVRSSAKTTPVDADAVLLQDSADSSLWKRLTWANLKGAVKTYLDTFKGVAGGYASLDGSGKVPVSELTIDSTPTNGSANPVSSDAVFDSLALKQNTLTFDSTPTNGSTNPVTSDGVFDALALKSNKPVVATATLSTGSWSLVSGLQEQSISNVDITASSVVDIIPDNAAASVVSAAQILPRTDSSSGAVKVYATNLPTANIGVTLNIWN